MGILVPEIKEALAALSIPEKKEFYPRFFKAGKGEYAEGDLFIGVTVPDQRAIAKNYWKEISPSEIEELISSPYHEHRSMALFILVMKYEKAKTDIERKTLVDLYLQNRNYVNNWDLVDLSCYKILGHDAYIRKDDHILRKLSNEESIWSKRMAIVGTLFFIKKGEFELTKTFVKHNMQHPHDLIHKANGWMLREMGKRNSNELLDFLQQHYHTMPRTCLRYAIEKLEPSLRQDILKGIW